MVIKFLIRVFWIHEFQTSIPIFHVFFVHLFCNLILSHLCVSTHSFVCHSSVPNKLLRDYQKNCIINSTDVLIAYKFFENIFEKDSIAIL